jgi:hypothetical protein
LTVSINLQTSLDDNQNQAHMRLIFYSQILPHEPLSVSAFPVWWFTSVRAAGADAAIIEVSIQILSATGGQYFFLMTFHWFKGL